MKKYMGKLHIEAIQVVLGDNEEQARGLFYESITSALIRIQKENPSIKFSATDFVFMTELPEGI